MKKFLANGITLLNAACGSLSIFLSIKGQFHAAVICIIAAMIFDVCDGRVARALQTESNLGKELDSLCDACSFGIAPVILIYSLHSVDWVFILLAITFVCCGIYRLARFNISENNLKGYEGVPITVHGLLIPVLFFLQAPPELFYMYLPVMSVLMVSRVRIPKL